MLIALLCTREFDILAQALLDAPPRGPVRLPYGFARGSTPTPGCAELEPHARRRAMNHLIASLPEAARSLLEPSLEPVPLRPADILHQIGGSVDYVYFPSSGMVSLVVTMESGQTADTSIIGREGMVCSAIVFDVHHAMDQATVAVAGQAMRIRTPDFTTAYKANEPAGIRTRRHCRTRSRQSCHSSTTSSCSGISPTASATIASAITAAIVPMSASLRRTYKRSCRRPSCATGTGRCKSFMTGSASGSKPTKNGLRRAPGCRPASLCHTDMPAPKHLQPRMP